MLVSRNHQLRERCHSPVLSQFLKVPGLDATHRSNVCAHAYAGACSSPPSTSPRLWTTLPLPRMRIPSSRSGNRLLPISIRCSGASDTSRLIWITGINAKRDTSGAGRTRHRGPGRVPPCFAPLFAWTSPRRVCPSIRSGTGNRDLWSSELRRERDRLSGATQLRTHRCNAEQPGVRRSAAGHGQGVDTWAHNDFVGDH